MFYTMDLDKLAQILQVEFDEAVELMRAAAQSEPNVREVFAMDAAAKQVHLNRARGYLGLKPIIIEGVPEFPEHDDTPSSQIISGRTASRKPLNPDPRLPGFMQYGEPRTQYKKRKNS
jgi:hypothetical protein